MDDEIKVSVVMLVYNHEKYVAQALDSILMQKTRFKIEVLIGEDCSSDNGKKILKQYEENFPGFFTVFYREKNMGATKNLYHLLQHAKGKYIAYLEGDDFWKREDKLQTQVDFMECKPQIQGVAGDFQTVTTDGTLIKETCIDKKYKDKLFTWTDFLENGFVFQTATLMHKNFFLDGGDYAILYKSHDLVGDLTINTILLNRGDIFILPEVLSAYRVFTNINAQNACTTSKRKPVQSIIKSLKQYEMLNTLVIKKKNYDQWIGEKKAGFLITMLKRENDFTPKNFLVVLKIGNWKTNLIFIRHIFALISRKLKKY